MNTELYIENLPADITAEISALLNFAIDDLKDFSSRSTTWSKTIVLPGTSNNNKLFGGVFDIGVTNPYVDGQPNVGFNFNASKSADCIIFQDQLQTFTGVLRLMQINIVKGNIEYEVSVFGKLAGLNVALSSSFLHELDFSAYDETYHEDNIIASWTRWSAADYGSGLYYPLIDYGTYGRAAGLGITAGKNNWDYRTFRPALYVKEYIDKMFDAANFRFSSALFSTDRFKKLIIPFNNKELTVFKNDVFSGTLTGGYPIFSPNGQANIEVNPFVAPGFTTTDNKEFTYTGASASFSFNLRVRFHSSNAASSKIRLKKNGVTFFESASYIANSPHSYDEVFSNISTSATSGDKFTIVAFQSVKAGSPFSVFTVESGSTISITTGLPVQVPATRGDTIRINDTIPKNIRQIDFLVSIIKLFNLYVYEDKFDPSLIYITPYIDFYSTNSLNAVDWTYKLNRDKAVKVKPMSELTAKKYQFKFKADNDYYNELYRKRYNEGYGDYTFDSQYEFADQTKSFELIFSATPLVGYLGEDKVYSTIFNRTGPDYAPVEENTDSNIRIMQTKIVTGITTWDILDDATIRATCTIYPYAGHFNDPDAPANDLNFGALKELFFTIVVGNLSVTQFNVYWSGYMAEITDKDSKLLTGKFYLTPKDILELDFSKFIYLDGNLFRLMKISDYNTTIPNDCEVQLLKVINTLY